MTVRLLARHSLLVGLVASLTSVGGFGCADDTSKSSLDPEGPPVALQVFVRDFVSTDDPFGAEYALAFGIHEDVWKCTVVDRECPTGLTCQEGGNLDNHCVDSTGEMPGATSAQAGLAAGGASIRIISKELLEGQTLEQFACACYPGTCPSGGEWAIDPEDCSACGDDTATPINESGRCLDVNNDRVPDLATLQAGVAVITCAGVTGFGSNGVYTTAQGDGYYYPSGNQLPSSAFGYGGIGPAVVIEPLIDLPTSADCTITLTNKVTDKDDNPFEPFTAEFTTEAFAALGTTPSGQTVPINTTSIAVNFNADLDPTTVTGTNIQLRQMDMSALTVTVAPSTTVPSRATITVPAGTLQLNTMYEVVVAPAIADSYGKAMGGTSPQILSFKTATTAPTM